MFWLILLKHESILELEAFERVVQLFKIYIKIEIMLRVLYIYRYSLGKLPQL